MSITIKIVSTTFCNKPSCQNSALIILDIGANLTDGMYKGLYHGTQRHEPDLSAVLGRAWKTGIKNIIVTGGSLTESKEALELVQQDGNYINIKMQHSTVGLYHSLYNY
jgi:Tat protein secretion system quality control protein TatD with DNase activity